MAGNPRAAAALALACGALTVAGFSPFGFPFLPYATLAVLTALWLRADTPRQAGAVGFAFGIGLFGAGVSWIYVSLHDFGSMPAPLAALATLIYCAFLGLFPALVGNLQARIEGHRVLRAVVLIPALWTISEWMREWLLTGFPWLSLGYSQIEWPLSGFAPIAGVFAVTLALTLAAGLVHVALCAGSAARIVALGALALLLGGSWWLRGMEWTRARGAPVRVALVQGNIAQSLKFEESHYAAMLATYARLIESSRARLIVLPETAIPRFLDTVDPRYIEHLERLARSRGADILVGVPWRDASQRYFNGAVSLGASKTQFYAKSHLVPLGEFVPGEFGWIVSVLKIPLSDFSRGGPQRPMALAGERVAVNICYEDAFGEEIIRQLPEATLLANLSNVAWFGRSLAPDQHLQMSRMRALETGRMMLRATNTGVTAIIGPKGEVIAAMPQYEEGVLEGQAQGYAGATPYVRWGNIPVLLLAFAMLLATLIRARRRGA